MESLKYTIRKYYHVFFNLFFRGNNLLKIKLLKTHSNLIHIGEGSVLKNCHFNISGGGNILLIGKNCNLQGVSFFMASDNNRILIHDNVVINSSRTQPTLLNSVGGKLIRLGKGCLLSNSIEIHTTDYHKVFDERNQLENEPQNVLIGENVWIGLQCLILKGTDIANNCVVGARSFLNKHYSEENSLIVGQPAKIIKHNIKWKK